VAAEPYAEEGGTAIRPVWSGTISFGLVSIPVGLFPANRPQGVSLRIVASDGTPLQRRYLCSREQKPLEWDEIVRGYETKKGKFVVVTDEELEALEPRKSRDIDLQLFVNQDEIDPIFFERAYYLVPTSGSNKAYRLLADVMESTHRAGIATFVMRTKEYVVAILAEHGILRAETLRFQDEVKTPAALGLPKAKKPKPAEVRKFEAAIKTRSRKVDLSEFLDDYALRLEKLAERKRRNKEELVTVPQEAPEEEGAEVIDLQEVLQRSLKPQARRRAR